MPLRVRWDTLSDGQRLLPLEIALEGTQEAYEVAEHAGKMIEVARSRADAVKREAEAMVEAAVGTHVEAVRCLAATIDRIWGKRIRILLYKVGGVPPINWERFFWNLAQGEPFSLDVTEMALGFLTEVPRFCGHHVYLRIQLAPDGSYVGFEVVHPPYDPAVRAEWLARQAIEHSIKDAGLRDCGVAITIRPLL